MGCCARLAGLLAVLWAFGLGNPNLPEPRVVVDELDGLASLQHLLGLGGLSVLRAGLEVHEHTLVLAVVLVRLGDRIDSFNLAEVELFEHVPDTLLGDVEVHPRNAETREVRGRGS